MAPEVAETIIKEFISVVRTELEDAAGLALAAEACAERGSIGKAVEIANEIDGHAHDANRILGVVALISRRYIPRYSVLDSTKMSESTMSGAAESVSIHDLLRLARERVDRTVAIASAAERQAEQGDMEKAVTTLLGIEQQLYEATTFINAASLINRISSS